MTSILRRNPQSLKAKVAAAALATTVAAVSISYAFASWREGVAQRDEFIAHQSAVAEMLTTLLSASVVFKDTASADALLVSVHRMPAVQQAFVLSPDGSVFASSHSGVRPQPGPLPHELQAKLSPGRLEVRAPIRMGDQTVGQLVMVSSLSALRAAMAARVRTAVLLLVPALLIALIGVYVLVGLALKPVERLSAVIREARRSGDYSRRAPRASDDELAALTDEFNALFQQLGEQDVALRQSMAELTEARDKAEAASRAKSEFLANMSHEIRTPLNGVLGVASALAKTELALSQREMLSIIETSAKTLQTLLCDVLDLARIEAGKMELRPEPFDLATSVQACAALFDAAAQAKGLDLEVDIRPEAFGAYIGDAARIRQILSNLLGNAVKFTAAGGIKLTVDARAGETDSTLFVSVADTGIGFDAATKKRLFSRFEQADGSITRRFGGSGLGLAISRSLAEAMGGNLDADAELGRGATFSLTLQLPRCEAAVVDRMEDQQNAEPASHPTAGVRVLLAEDHPVNRRVVELILEAAGVELTCVENGAEAVAAFRRDRFDLILMDMQMPVMDGLTAIREIRGIEAAQRLDRTPIHVLTGNAMPEHVSASLAAGADGHLTKPVVAESLLQSVVDAAGTRSKAA